MNIQSKSILQFIRKKSDRPLKIKELAQKMNIPSKEYSKFRNIIKELIGSGTLVMLKRNRVGLASEMNILVGKIALTRSGMGFLLMEGDAEDILIPEPELLTAMDGDRVMVRLSGSRGGRQIGSVIKVVERVGKDIVGIYNRGRKFSYVIPDNSKIRRDIYIPDNASGGARDGEKVVVSLNEWEDPHLNPDGEIIECLGFPGAPGVDIKTVIKNYDLPEKFSDEVLAEAQKYAADFDTDTVRNRLDLSEENIFTIDPSDAKDHDDAVSIEKISGGFKLGVHIADVSYFVKEGTALDKEALRRGNSTYLPGSVIPMLPETLSNNICSLRVNRKRLAFSVFIDYDNNGKIKTFRLVDTIIKSKAKLSYQEVQDFYDGKKPVKAIEKVKEELLLARRLAGILSKRRFAEGSLDFDLPESKIILNKKGEVQELGNRVRLESHRLVEEFMLAANKVVAYEVLKQGQPFLYRVHDKPDKDKLENFSNLMKSLGYKFAVSPQTKPIHLARFLDMIKDKAEADFINELMVRSMKKAVYQRENIGHFGLAFQYYSHFTSPIRRYPDLVVHRLLRKLKNGRYPAAFASRVSILIDNVSTHCSETERNSEAAERDAIKAKQVSYMAKHVGDHFPGVISGITGFGMFVRLDNLGAEGMVRISSVDDDYYKYDEKSYRLKGSRHGRSFRLGDKVEVIVSSVDKIKTEINLNLVPTKKAAHKKEKPRPKKLKVNRRKKKKRN